MAMCTDEPVQIPSNVDFSGSVRPSSLVVGKYAFSRAGIAMNLERDGIPVLGEAESLEEAAGRMAALHPSLAFFDLFEADMEQFNSIGRIKTDQPSTFLGVFVREPSVDDLKHALRAGVSAFIMKGVPMIAPLRVIARHMLRGGLIVDPGLMARFVAGLTWSHQEPTRDETHILSVLSDSDRLILRLIAHGETAPGIAAALNVAPGTIRNRLTRLYRAIDVLNRSEAAAFAVRSGLAS